MDVDSAARVPSRDQCGKLCNALLISLHYASEPDQVISDVGVMPGVRAVGMVRVVVGPMMGTMVGTMVGTMGTMVGTMVGAVVGTMVGTMVGAIMGAIVGAIVGAIIGAISGAIMGAIMGAMVFTRTGADGVCVPS